MPNSSQLRLLPSFAYLVVAASLCTIASSPVHAKLSASDLTTLQTLAESYRLNYDSIRTWVGEGTLHATAEVIQGNDERLSIYDKYSVCEFSVDNEAGCVRWELVTSGEKTYFMDKLQEDILVTSAYMKKDGFQYEYDRPNSLNTTIYVDSYSEPAGVGPHTALTHTFNPIDFITEKGRPIDEILLRIVDSHQPAQTTARIDLENEGTLWILTLEDFEKNTLFTYVFDEAKAGNMVEREFAKEGQVLESQRYKYELVNGAYLPTSVYYESSYHVDDATSIKSTVRRVSITTQEINNLADPPDFSLESLGVMRNDRILNKTVDIDYIYNPAKWIEY